MLNVVAYAIFRVLLVVVFLIVVSNLDLLVEYRANQCCETWGQVYGMRNTGLW